MQNIQTKEDVKQASHRLHRKMKSLVPGTNLSQAQEALASVFGMRNFDSLMAAMPSAENRALPEEIGVRWVHYTNGVETSDNVREFCETEFAFKQSLLQFVLRIERDLLGGNYRMYRERFSQENGWVRDDAEPVAIYEDCALVGGSLRDWLTKARVQALKDIGVWGVSGRLNCSVTIFADDRQVQVVGVYKETTIAGGFDHYILHDHQTGKQIPLKDGNFARCPDYLTLRKALEKAGYLPPQKA